MKRVIILFALTILATNSFAQKNDNGKLWISAQGGIMFSNVYSARGHNYNREYGEYVLWASEMNTANLKLY